MKYLLAIDLGTTNIKSILFDVHGKAYRQSSYNLTTLTPAENHSEQNPDEIIQGVMKAIGDLNIGNLSNIKAVVLSGAMHSIFPVDKHGKPLLHAMLWSDLRSSAIAKELKSTELGTQLHHETGTPVHPMNPLCKLIWMEKHASEFFKSAHKFISIKEYLVLQLTEKYIVDQSIASATGLMDIEGKSWSDKALAIAGITPEQLSNLQAPSYSLPITHNILKGIPLILGGGDGCLANLGSGVIDNTRVALTIGTSAALRTTLQRPNIDPNLRSFCYFVDDAMYVSGGATNNGGNIFEWLQTEYKIQEKDITATPPGSNGLITLPYVFGERAPYWETGKSAVTVGQNSKHTSGDIARSYIEGICFNLKLIGESIDHFDSITASGGFTKSSFWPQMVADVFNKPLHILQTGENTALGAAFLAMKSLGLIQNYSETLSLIETNKTFYPDKHRNEIYTDSFQKFNELIAST